MYKIFFKVLETSSQLGIRFREEQQRQQRRQRWQRRNHQ